jgi:hypothetical protein
MDTPNVPPLPPKKKGLGPIAWLGIGCGGLILLIVIGFVIIGIFFGPAMKKFAQEAQTNPTRAMATMMVSMGRGEFEMVAEDDANKRYTVKQKSTGQLTTVYWDAKYNKPATVSGDFSAIPKDTNAPGTP